MVKKYFLLFYFIVVLVAVSTVATEAQTVIGMGTEQPNPNAVLELVPEQGNQGFLAPRLTTAQRQASSFTGKLSRADHGLLVFDINEGKFYYWFDGAWREGTSGRTGSPTSEISGTTWYTGTTAPSGVDAAEGDFYINESTGEVFKFDGNAFVSMGSIKGGPAANSPNLSSVLQQGSSAGNRKITDLNSPTDDNDAVTKKYVDDRETAIKTYVDQEILTVPGGSVPSLEQVLIKDANSNDAGGKQIVGLGNPTADNHAATKFYVDNYGDADNQSLENVLTEGNTANNNYQIKGLIDPTDPQDAATKNYVDTKSKVSAFALDGNNLTLTEGGVPHTVDVGPLKNGTPAALPEGNIFVGDNSSTPQAVTITGDISISPTGEVTINNAKITTDKIANAAVTKEKINADVAGPGLAKDTNADGLRVNTGNGLIVDSDSDEVKISPFPEGWIGIGQGLGVDMNFKKVDRDGSLNKDGELTVKGLQGRTVANTAPSNKQVLQWDNGANEWAPATLTGGGSLPALPNGRLFIGNNGNQPTPTAISGDIAIAANGTATIAADAVDQTKISPDVAGAGLSQAGDGSLRVNLVGDVTTGGGGSNLTVTKLQGNQVAPTPPSTNGQVLTWNGSQWAPASLPPGGGSQQWYAANSDPNVSNPSGSQNGDYYLRTTNPIGNEKVYRKVGGTWQELGGFTSTKDLNLNGSGYSYRAPWLYVGTGEPNNNAGKVGDFYYDNSDKKLYFKKGANEWDDF